MENKIKITAYLMLISCIILSVFLLTTYTNIIFQNILEEDELIEKIDKGVEQNDTLVCNEIRNEQQRSNCINNVNYGIILNEALLEEDINICQRIEESMFRQMCEDRLHNYIALVQENTSYCENINDNYLKQSCFNQ